MKLATLILSLSAATLSHCPSHCLAQASLSNQFTYQGRLDSGGSPLNGTADVQFSLWDSVEAGTQIDSTVAQNNIAVGNGLFTATPDFGAAAFNGSARWVQIAVRSPAGSGEYTTLAPRQALSVVPNALYAKNNWALSGNAGTDPATDFVGTSDLQPLVFKVNSRRAMQYHYAENTSSAGFEYRSMNVLGGSEINEIAGGVEGATIAGGGWDSFTNTDYPNRVLADFGTVGGGIGNTASFDFATVGGGILNTASNFYTTVAGGSQNTASGFLATVGGGDQNTANNSYATVGGGFGNTATGFYATVPGGRRNTAAGNYSFAAGRQAKANHSGSFVWADNTEADFASSNTNQFCIRATGGIVLETNQNAFLYTSSTVGEKNRYVLFLNSPQTSTASGVKAGGILCADSYGYANPGKNDMIVKGTLAVGYSSASPYTFAVNGSVFANGSYSSSDARYKKNIVSFRNALDVLVRLRGVSFDWDRAKFPDQNFTAESQMGFIAQEVESVFPQLVITGPDGFKAVNYTGVIPVVVEAVKAQQKQIDDLKADVAKRGTENADLRVRLERLEQRLNNKP